MKKKNKLVILCVSILANIQMQATIHTFNIEPEDPIFYEQNYGLKHPNFELWNKSGRSVYVALQQAQTNNNYLNNGTKATIDEIKSDLRNETAKVGMMLPGGDKLQGYIDPETNDTLYLKKGKSAITLDLPKFNANIKEGYNFYFTIPGGKDIVAIKDQTGPLKGLSGKTESGFPFSQPFKKGKLHKLKKDDPDFTIERIYY